MKKIFKFIKQQFLTVFGDIKVCKWPMFIIYSPTSFKVKGIQTRKAEQSLEIGDIIQRGYDDYIDGKFIPGRYSHSAIYIGNNTVIHAIAEGVQKDDIIDFFRCDRFRILRCKERGNENWVGKGAALKSLTFLNRPYDFDFKSGNKAMYCHEVVAEAYLPEVELHKLIPRLWWIKGSKTYLAESFDGKFEVVMEYNPKEKINAC